MQRARRRGQLRARGNGYHSAAKGALELATEALGKETEHLGMRVLLVDPGALRSRLEELHEWAPVGCRADLTPKICQPIFC